MWLNLLVDDCKCGNTTKLIGKINNNKEKYWGGEYNCK
jgi:hypothetical protein